MIGGIIIHTRHQIRMTPILCLVFALMTPLYAQETQPQETPAASASGQAQGEQATTQPAPDMDPALWEQLAEINQRLGEVEDLSAAFVQQKFTVLLSKPMSSRGRVYMMGPRTLWQTHEPHPSTILITDSELLIYYPQQKSAEAYPLSERLAMLAASPMPPLDTLAELFHVSRVSIEDLSDGLTDIESPGNTTTDVPTDTRFLAIRLTPRDQTLEEVQSLDILIDLNQSYARRIVMTDADGERTVLTFTDLKINTGLDPEQLELKLPGGTRISRPLGAISR